MPLTVPIRGMAVATLGPPYVGAMRSLLTMVVHVVLADGSTLCGRTVVGGRRETILTKRNLCTACCRKLKLG